MASHQEKQMEQLVDQALKHSNFQGLEEFLSDKTKEEITSKCSKQFISKLDKLIHRELDHRNVKHACLVFTILHKLGDRLVFPEGEGISVMVSKGIVGKWYEKVKKIWVEAGPVRNEMMVNLAEDFFDALMVVHESCKEGTYQVTESMIHHIGKLATDPKVNILIRKESVRKLNVILGKIPLELKKQKKILSSQEASSVMNDLASQILRAGDYDLQVALMEALCRMTSHAQRRKLAGRWFTMEFVASAFRKIQDSEFETDCRKFLNLVNGMQGDGRSVYSFPCLEVFLDKHVLLMPADENLKEFWIDFNLGSQSISFYFCLADHQQEGQWDTMWISEHDVLSYFLQEEKDAQVLQLVLIDPLYLSNIEGSRLTIHFSSSLDIRQATKKVFGEAKHKKFVGKTSTSVVKTTVQIVLEEGGSQVLFPESQTSSQPLEKAAPTPARTETPCQSLPHCDKDAQRLSQMTTPLRSKVSESCMYVSGSAGRRLGQSPFCQVLPAVVTPAGKAKVKPALEMVASSERVKEYKLRELMTAKSCHSVPSVSEDKEDINRHAITAVMSADKQQDRKDSQDADKYCRNIPVEKVLEMVQAENNLEEEPLDNSVVPDSQPAVRKATYVVPGLGDLTKRRISVSESLVSFQKEMPQHQSKPGLSAPSPFGVELPPQPSSACYDSRVVSPRQLHAQLTQKLAQVLKQREQQGELSPMAQSGRRQPESSAAKKGPAHGEAPKPAKPTQNKHLVNEDAKSAKAADNMVEQISSHYKSNANEFASRCNTAVINKYFFNKSWCPSSAVKAAASMAAFQKSCNQSKDASNQDVFEFSLDVPEVSVKCRKSSDVSGVKSSVLSSSQTLPSSSKKPLPVKPTGRNVKKHLFSDTDADNTSDGSWLKSANRRPKPKIVDYSRQPVKPIHPPADTTSESPNVPPPLPKAAIEPAKPKRKRQRKVVEQMDKKSSRADSRKPTGRPQRSTALSISYRELSDSEGMPNAEGPPPAKKLIITQTEKPQRKTTVQRREQAGNKATTSPEAGIEQTVQENNKTKAKTSNTNTVESRASKMSSFHPSPRSTSKTRYAEKLISLYISPNLDHLSKKFTVRQSEKPQKPASVQAKGQTGIKERTSTKEKEKTKSDHMFMEKANKQAKLSPESKNKTPLKATVCSSPPSIEKIRSTEKTTDLPRSPLTPLRPPSISPVDALSPIHQLPSHIKGIQASFFYKTSGSVRRPPHLPITSVTQKQKSAAEVPDLSLVPSVAQHLLASTGKEKLALSSTLSSPDMEEHLGGFTSRTRRKDQQASCDKESVISFVTLSHSSHRSMSSIAMIRTEVEKTPECTQGSSGKTGFKSGPATRRKRHHSGSSSSLSEREYSDDDDGDEDKENKVVPTMQARKLKPRRLFTPNGKPPPAKKSTKQPLGEHISSEDEEEEEEGEWKKERRPTSAAKKNDLPPHPGSPSTAVEEVQAGVDVDVDIDLTQTETSTSQQMGYVCRQFSSELKRKFENRSRRMDQFTTQSLKALRQHVSSIGLQVHNHRFQRLEKVKRVLMDEMKSLEQDDVALRSMEEELTTYWKKQVLAFHAYQERGSRRLHHLKNVVEINVQHSLEREEQIFSTQMCLMRKDMKSVQERFFRQMQEEELLSVRRGLQSLFLPDVPMF